MMDLPKVSAREIDPRSHRGVWGAHGGMWTWTGHDRASRAYDVGAG